MKKKHLFLWASVFTFVVIVHPVLFAEPSSGKKEAIPEANFSISSFSDRLAQHDARLKELEREINDLERQVNRLDERFEKLDHDMKELNRKVS